MTVSPVTYYRVRWRQWKRGWDAGVYRLITFLELDETVERMVKRLSRWMQS